MTDNIKHSVIRWKEGREFQASTESGHCLVMDAPEQYGGKNNGPSPMEVLLASVGGCTGMDVVEILRKKQQAVSGVEIRVEATRAETYPKIYTDIELIYLIRGKNISAAAVEEAIHLSETKYCSVSIMLGRAARVRTRYEIVSE
jgi:putative redox protein